MEESKEIIDNITHPEKIWVCCGFKCVAMALESGHRCGYVGIPKRNHLYEFDYNESTFDSITVHGGLTYSAKNTNDYPIVTKQKLWFFGFDCAHLGDKRDVTLMSESFKKSYLKYLGEGAGEGGIIRSLEFVIEECESLARQLKDICKQ